MSDYEELIKKNFVGNLVTQSANNPHAYWLQNTSNVKRGTPDLAGWMKTHKSLATIYKTGLPAVKAALLDLAQSGAGDASCAAMTLIVVRFNLVEGKKTKEVRTALVGTSSLNQHVGKGQVHAEHITTDTLVSLILNANGPLLTNLGQHTKSEEGGTLVLDGPVDVFVYPSQPGPSKPPYKNVSDFAPCESCVQTVGASLKRLKKKVNLVGCTGGIEVD